MKYSEVIEHFVKGTQKRATLPQISFRGNQLYSYESLLCERRKGNETGKMVYCVNMGLRSATTNKQRHMLLSLIPDGQLVTYSDSRYGQTRLPTELQGTTTPWED